jgi:hypothetical protein
MRTDVNWHGANGCLSLDPRDYQVTFAFDTELAQAAGIILNSEVVVDSRMETLRRAPQQRFCGSARRGGVRAY